jgi:hypothetical protein
MTRLRLLLCTLGPTPRSADRKFLLKSERSWLVLSWGTPRLVLNMTAGDVASLRDAKLADVEYEIEPADEVFASIRYPHQQFTLE